MVKEADHYRLRLPCETLTYELTGITPKDEDDTKTKDDPWDDFYFTIEELRRFQLNKTYQPIGEKVESVIFP